MLMISNPFSFKPFAIVDLPAPGIPVRQTINFDKFVDDSETGSMKLPEIIIKIISKML